LAANNQYIPTKIYVLLLIAAYLFAACNVTKNVPPGDKLFTGSTTTTDSVKIDKLITTELQKMARPIPNTNLLGFKYRLVLFNAIDEPKKQKGFLYKMKYKWGQPPVLLSTAKPKITETRFTEYLFSKGFLKAGIKSETLVKENTASIKYTVSPGERYKIKNIIYSSDSTPLNVLIVKSKEESLLKKGEYFDLNTLNTERNRIDNYLKQFGYYFFIPDFLLFKVDSLHQGQADLYVTLKEGIPQKALDVWKLGDIVVYSNYKLQKDSFLRMQQGKKVDRFTIVDPDNTYLPITFKRAIMMREGQIYNKDLHNLTIERLMNLNTFKFVKITFAPAADSTLTLNSKIYLTPSKKQTVRFEVAGNTLSNNFIGTELTLNYRNLNLFKGAEILEAKISGGYDVQLGGKQQLSKQAINVKAEINLFVPRILPLSTINIKRNPYIPRTVFTGALEYIQRPDLYTMRSLNFAAGYHFKVGKSIEHNLRVINLNSIDPTDITPKFDSILAEDITLRASFEKQFIIGSRYEFKYNNTYRTGFKFNQIFNGYISTSGSLVNLFISAKPDTVGAKKIFNIPVSQFVRFQVDWRGYWQIRPKLNFVNRIVGGVALAFGNSSAVPYSEQFFIGGSTSLRGFRARTLGPGTYHTPKTVYQANQSGEIIAQYNSEMRYDVSKYIKLAAFADVGNIWWRKDAPGEPGSGLYKGEFFNELAVDGGLGIRIDVSIMVIRFDFAIPLRKPWYPDGKKWVFNEVGFGSSQWRKDNLLLNIGIGYPF
jgi:outer membrane protein assembly factor BamA